MLSDFRIIEGKNRIKGGGGGVKNDPKNRTSFMNDPLRTLCTRTLHMCECACTSTTHTLAISNSSILKGKGLLLFLPKLKGVLISVPTKAIY